MSPRRFDFPLTLALTALAALLSWAFARELPLCELFLAEREAIARGELWRLFTGALVHVDAGQAGRDLSVFFLLGAVHEGLFGRRWPLLLLLLLPVGPLLALWGPDAVPCYFGLSAAVNGLFAVSLWCQWQQARAPWIGLVALLFFVKLLYEGLSGGMLMPMALERGARPLPIAHVGGALMGALLALLLKKRESALK